MSGRRRPPRWLLAACLVLTACNDDGSDAAPDAPATTADGESTATAAPAPAAGGEEPAVVDPGDAALTLGFLGPGVGLLSDLGIGQERGLALAVADINEAGGALGGPVATVRADEATDRSIDAVLDELVDAGADVVVGPVGSATAVALGPVLDERSLLACSASATAVSVTADGRAETFFRTALRDDHLVSFVAEELMSGDDPPGTVMILGRDDEYGTELTGGLAAELSARGAAVETLAYPARRVAFPDEAAAVTDAAPDRLVVAAFEEGPGLVSTVVRAGYPVGQIVGLDGMLVPRLAEQTFPDDPAQADGLTVIGTTGDRALTARLRTVPAAQDQVSYGAQMYDCAITLALAAIAAGSATAASIGAAVASVTSGGRTCSTFAHCVELLSAGEDIHYSGTTGGIEIDEQGDTSTARITTARVIEGRLTATAAEDVDLVALRQQELFAQSVFTTRLQQGLKVLGFYDGDVTGVWDDATTDALRALQRELGLPETGEYDEATDAAFRELLGNAGTALTTSIEQLQEGLTELGYYRGPIDGRYSQATIDAVRALQRDLGVPPTGLIDAATLRAIYERGRQSATSTGSTTTTTNTTTTTTTTTTGAPPPTTTTVAPPPRTTLPPTTQPPATPPPTTTRPPTTPPPTTPPPTTSPPTTAPPTTPPPTTLPPTTAPPTTQPTPPTTIPPETAPTLFELLAADPRFSTLVELLQSVGYDGDLGQRGPFTVFPPTNDAFAALPDGALDELRADPSQVEALLSYHAVIGELRSADLVTGPVTSIHGAPLQIAVDGARITVNEANVVEADLTASNGVAHVIDAVLIPPS